MVLDDDVVVVEGVGEGGGGHLAQRVHERDVLLQEERLLVLVDGLQHGLNVKEPISLPSLFLMGLHRMVEVL